MYSPLRLWASPSLYQIISGFLLITSLLANTLSAADAKKPNILLIVGDDMGYADVGFHGGKEIPTPNFDALAKAGVRCTNGYVTAPYCSPSRAGMLSGRYQTRFGHEFNADEITAGLPLTETTLASRLQSAGYVTGLVGKWHLGHAEKFQPQNRGFDEFFGFLPSQHDYFADAGLLRGTEPVEEKEYLTDAFGREAVDFIERHKSESWFLYLAFNAVHTPMQADDARLKKFEHITDTKRRTYAAMMTAMDDAIGRVRKKLDELGLAQNTLITFNNDNGGPTMPSTATNGSINTPLRGSKRTTLEGGLRVPFLVSWPGKIQPGVYDKPVITLDFTATMLAAAGIKSEASWKQEGVDLVPYLSGQNAARPHETLYWRFGRQMAIRDGDFKLVRYDMNADTLSGAPNQPTSPPRLYNLAEDIGEAKDLAATMPDKLKELDEKWNAWNKENVPPLWTSGLGGTAPAKKAKKAKTK